MKKKKIIATALLLSLVSFSGASAFDVSYVRETGKITVSGKGLESGETARMVVLKPGADREALENGTVGFFESAAAIAEIKNESGDEEYAFPTFSFDENASAGIYKIIVRVGEKEETYDLDYATVSQILGFLTNAENDETVLALFEKYNDEIYKLEIGEDSEYAKLDDDGKLFVRSSLIGTTYENAEAVQKRFNDKVVEYIENFRKNAFKEISDAKSGSEVKAVIQKYEKLFMLDMSDNTMFGKLDESDKNLVFEKMVHGEYKDETELSLAFEQKTILRYIEKGPWGVVGDYLDTYNDTVLKLTLPATISESLKKEMVKNTYNNVSDLQNVINPYLGVGGNGGGTGGGGSSSSGSKKDNTIKPSGTIGAANVGAAMSSGTPINTEKNVFNDVPKSHWAYEPIKALKNKNIISGVDEKNYAPESFVKRGEAAKLIVNAFFGEPQSGKEIFTDVKNTDWEFKYVSKAVDLGIIKGYSDLIFGKDDFVTREDLCVMLCRAKGVETTDESNLNYSDSNEISPYAKGAVSALSNAGVVSGSNGSFNPKSFATRAEIAKLIYGLLD